MRTPEQRSGGCDISFGQEGSDAGRRDDTTRVGDEVDGSHLESEPVSLLLQGDHVAGSITPETEVGPDTHQPGLAPIDQYLLRELSGEHLSYLSEIEKAHPIHAQFVEQLHATFDGGQEGRGVLRGEARGRELGFPTANLAIPEGLAVPADGIYAVRVAGGVEGIGVASLGVRPTFGPSGERLLETFVFDFAGDLYGRTLHVDFVARLRGEERFDSVEALVRQMEDDARQAREILSG
jgi:hypothetical protein